MALYAFAVSAQDVYLPLKKGSVRFAVIGDSGTGHLAQHQVGGEMEQFRKKVHFTFVLMLGDNIYGSESRHAFRRKFERPYQTLLENGVSFYAALGNHDLRAEEFYAPFHMNGNAFYSFAPAPPAHFFALDSTHMDAVQIQWLRKELAEAGAGWKICFMHHPLYSSGYKHGASVSLRRKLEPVLREYAVNVVFAGHEHFYERIKPQQGVAYFISGAAARTRRAGIAPSPIEGAGFDGDCTFMLVEIAGDTLYYQVVSRTGQTIDVGKLDKNQPQRQEAAKGTKTE